MQIDEFLPTVVEFVRESNMIDDDGRGDEDDVIDEVMSRLGGARRLVDALESARRFATGASIEALLDVDGMWHDATVVEFDVAQRRCLARFDAWAVERWCIYDEFRAAADDARRLDELCQLCQCERKLTEHHVIPKEVHAQYRKKGFERAELNRVVLICRPSVCRLFISFV